MNTKRRMMPGTEVSALPPVDEVPEAETPEVDTPAVPEPLDGYREIPIYLRVKLPRKDVKLEPGDCLGRVLLPEGVDLDLLVDCIRHGRAGVALPK